MQSGSQFSPDGLAVTMPQAGYRSNSPTDSAWCGWIGRTPAHKSGYFSDLRRDYHRWLHLAEHDPHTSIHLHPRVVKRAAGLAGAPPLILARKASGPADIVQSIAVLASRTVQVRPLPPFRWSIPLRGRSVVANQILGDASPQATHHMLQAMCRLVMDGQADCLLFSDLPANSPIRQQLAEVARRNRARLFYPVDCTPHWYIRFPERPGDYWQQFSKKTRYNFRWRARKLPHELLRITGRDQVPYLLDQIRSLLERTWQYRRLGLQFPCDQRMRRIYENFADMGALRCYLLEQDGRPIAFATGIQWKNQFIFEETGYDPQFASFSPGNVLLHRLLEDLIEHDTPRLFDFGYGDAEYKRIFGNHQEPSGPVLLAPPRLGPVVALSLEQFRRRTGRTARWAMERMGALSLIRKIYRR